VPLPPVLFFSFLFCGVKSLGGGKLCHSLPFVTENHHHGMSSYILMVGKLVVENYPLFFIKKKRELPLANFFDNFTLWLGV
jgi:hypothetical protein